MKSTVDLSDAHVVHSQNASGPAAKAVEVFIEEIAKRTGIVLPEAYAEPERYGSAIVVGTFDGLADLIGGYADKLPDARQLEPEGYLLQVVQEGNARKLFIIGADARGVLYGIGKMLRKSRLKEGSIRLDAELKLVSSPRYPIRGHQLGYRPKTNAYDAWTVEQYDQYIRELALFGANSIEILPPRTDDAPTGPLMKLDPMEMMIRLSAIIDSYGLNVWIWYPNMAEDYTDPHTREIELAERDDIFRKLTRIDAVLIPGSDPGGMDPDLLFEWSEEVSRLLHKYHPSAQIWLAPQVMKYEPKPWLEGFYRNVNLEPKWLGGVVYGPHVDEMLPDFREKIPPKYPIRRYEDITHNISCQYPVENWDLSLALTLGRECYNPRPIAEKHIHNVFAPYAQGNISYSEGINDDVNKFVWSDQDWIPILLSWRRCVNMPDF
ncbi:alpha-glucuronidase family glycosyl hydrolase [Gordoniibacillus kamchatkensis]|uniref:alpha-glucuronidase family glycosyl hydrolase n=1 Tax=Gordoniibacillus kamchatkensis TaxID=1590651 RepID=UPI000697F3AD|nr:alpha-glucuronidase family glycosyl hydrolase [Paenibacillus sp. VKM B-2647]